MMLKIDKDKTILHNENVLELKPASESHTKKSKLPNTSRNI